MNLLHCLNKVTEEKGLFQECSTQQPSDGKGIHHSVSWVANVSTANFINITHSNLIIIIFGDFSLPIC